MSMLDIVALQTVATLGDVTGNVERLVAALRAECAGADLVVTPELATTGYDLAMIDERGAELAEPLDGPTVGAITKVAAELGSTIMLGMLERDGDAFYDTLVTVLPDGAVHPFRKTHLYPPERARFAQGDVLQVVDTPAGRVGPLICFEHAFPELATTLALAGAEILVIPSAVPFGYEYLLTLRTRARAQDNQIFAVACNLAGGGFCGQSLIADPAGRVLAEAGTGESVLRAKIDLTQITRERTQEPALRLRRDELYLPGSVDNLGVATAVDS